MDVEWMKIDQMAKRSGLTKRTIRFYEEIGLLSSPKRTEGGVRLYSEDDLEELERVISAKEVLGFSLQELQQFMETGKHLEMNKEGYLLSLDKRERKEKLEDIQRMLNEQMRMIDEKIEKFQSFKKRLRVCRQKPRMRFNQLIKQDKRYFYSVSLFGKKGLIDNE